MNNRAILKTANRLLDILTSLFLCLVTLYALWSLWDNGRIYAAADNVQADLRKLKPAATESGETETNAAFEDLQKINPDVRAWLTLDGTGVDYPVVQGSTNLTYINRDVYGSFAMAGSIYLDAGNDPGFADACSLLYGHHMKNGSMFGDLDLYKQKEFFEQNTGGMLLLPERAHDLKVYAVLVVSASDEKIYETERRKDSAEELLRYAEQNALLLNREVLKELPEGGPLKLLALSTCSYEFTDARTVVLAVMTPHGSSPAGFPVQR